MKRDLSGGRQRNLLQNVTIPFSDSLACYLGKVPVFKSWSIPSEHERIMKMGIKRKVYLPKDVPLSFEVTGRQNLAATG